MIGAPSFSQSILWIQPTRQCLPRNSSSSSVNFHFLFHPYLFKLSSLRSPLTLPSYITQQFFTSLFLRTNIPTIYIKNIFPQTFCQFRLRQGTRELWSIVRTDTVLISPFFLKVWSVIAGLTHNH